MVSGKGWQPHYTVLTCPVMRLAAHLRLHCLPFCQPSIVTPCTRPAVSTPSAWRIPLGLVAASVCAAEQNKGTPVLMCHGDADRVVDYSFGKRRCSGWVSGWAGGRVGGWAGIWVGGWAGRLGLLVDGVRQMGGMCCLVLPAALLSARQPLQNDQACLHRH